MDNIVKTVGEILGYAIGALTLYFLWYIKEKIKKHPDTIAKDDVKVYRSIYEQLSILFVTGADRVYILEFHNGTDFSSSILQWKLSCTYELVRNGISRMQDQLQDIKASSMADYLETFYSEKDEMLLDGVKRATVCKLCTQCERKCTYSFDIEDMEENHLSAMLKMQGIYGMYQVGIRNGKGSLVGILGLDYCNKEHWDLIKDDEVEIPHKLKEVSLQISTIWEKTK